MDANTMPDAKGGMPASADGSGPGVPVSEVSIDELCSFMAKYVSAFISFGGQTIQVVRCAKRIGLVFGVEVEMVLLSRHAVINVSAVRDSAEHRTGVVPFKPVGTNFSATLRLNELSWELYDCRLRPLEESPAGNAGAGPGVHPLREGRASEEEANKGDAPATLRTFINAQTRFQDILRQPNLSVKMLCLMTGVAGAAFCTLFGGDRTAAGVVFFASQAGFLVRHCMVVKHGMDIRLGFLAASFTASFLSAAASRQFPGSTPEIAVASCILFLVPGIPLLSAVNDILCGHTLMGISRGVNAALLIICIAFGLAATLIVTGFKVL
ncbi:MAG: threonine/serine exporter family protein [Desulfovibrio sp.]|nr:threonine/serine exporter family protein [Desulfovibrio sp.]